MKVVLIILGIVVIPIVFNFCYLFIAVKLNIFKDFTKWIIDEEYGYNELWLFAPLMSLQTFMLIFLYLVYKLILTPLYYLTFYPLEKFFKVFSKVLYKPINKTIFKNKLNETSESL